VTLAAAKSALDVTSEGDDDLIEAFISRASAAILNYCDREFAVAQYTEYIDGDGTQRIIVRETPITDSEGAVLYAPTVTTITIWRDITREYADADKVDTTDIILYPKKGIVELYSGTFVEGRQSIKVQYYAGYAAVPQDVQQAAILMVRDWYLNRGHKNIDALGQFGPLDVMPFGEGATLPPKARALLAPYMRIRL